MSVTFISTDFLNFKDVDIIVLQANCLCVTPFGITQQLAQHCSWSLSVKIAETFPWANIYSMRRGNCKTNLAVKEDRGIPGTIRVFKSSEVIRPDIVYFLSQWDFGPSDRAYREIPPHKDTKENRIIWFKQCLEQLKKLNIRSVGIPNTICSAISGGEWKTYFDLIQKFAKDSGIQFFIVSPRLLKDGY